MSINYNSFFIPKYKHEHDSKQKINWLSLGRKSHKKKAFIAYSDDTVQLDFIDLKGKKGLVFFGQNSTKTATVVGFASAVVVASVLHTSAFYCELPSYVSSGL